MDYLPQKKKKLCVFMHTGQIAYHYSIYKKRGNMIHNMTIREGNEIPFNKSIHV